MGEGHFDQEIIRDRLDTCAAMSEEALRDMLTRQLRMTVIPKAGHFLMEDAPDAVAENVIGFIQGAGD